jgi:recombination protein RecT
MNAVPAQLPEARQERKDIQSMLQSPKMIERFKAIVPQHLNPQRMLRVMALAIHKVPKLAECDPVTLLGAMMVCASLGIEPNTPLGHAYLIPFEKKKKQGNQWVTERVDVNLIIGYRGYVDLARRSGGMVSIHADVVYEGDEFSFEYGSNMHLRHVPRGGRTGRKPIWAYAHAKLTDGEAFEVLPYDQVLEIRDGSQAYQQAVRAKEQNRLSQFESSPWVAFEHEMSAKTMVRRLSKWLPLSIEFANAAALDAMSEANKVDFSAFSNGGEALIDVEQARRPDEDPPQIGAPTEKPMTTVGDTGGAEKVAAQSTGKTQTAAAKGAEPPPAQEEPEHDPETGEIKPGPKTTALFEE